jgi:hypothetical protein
VSEVIVVDDGSLDGTAAVALAAGATVLRIPHRLGKGGALEAPCSGCRPPTSGCSPTPTSGTAGIGSRRSWRPWSRTVPTSPSRSCRRRPAAGSGRCDGSPPEAIALMSGFEAEQPLSGQRAVRGERWRAAGRSPADSDSRPP